MPIRPPPLPEKGPGRPRHRSKAQINQFKALALYAAEERKRRGLRITPIRVLRSMEESYGKDPSFHEFCDAYEQSTLLAFIRPLIRRIAGDGAPAPPLARKTSNWVRARLGQLGREDLAARYGDPAIEELRQRARMPGANPGDFKDEETVVLWILLERELVPEAVLDPDWIAKQSANLEGDWSDGWEEASRIVTALVSEGPDRPTRRRPSFRSAGS